MNECANADIREMLPDLLHGNLPAAERNRVESHLAGCVECTGELGVLRKVKSAAVFAPAIDVNGIVRQIPPYQRITPVTERPAVKRGVMWLVAGALALVIGGGGSLLMQQRGSVVATAIAPDLPPATHAAPAPIAVPVTEPVGSGESTVAQSNVRTHSLALATDVASLDDASLIQLMDDMDGFDGLPSAEPEPVLQVDSGEGLEQDSSL